MENVYTTCRIMIGFLLFFFPSPFSVCWLCIYEILDKMHRDNVFLELFLTSTDYGDSPNIICSLIVHKNSKKPMTKVALYCFNFTTTFHKTIDWKTCNLNGNNHNNNTGNKNCIMVLSGKGMLTFWLLLMI